MDEYDGRQFVGIDLHRRRSVIVRMTEAGERLEMVWIDNDPVALGLEIALLVHSGGGPVLHVPLTYRGMPLPGAEVDETGDLKKGKQIVGVQRQYTGTRRPGENAQVAVYLTYATDAGHAFIDRELYVPRSWADDPERRAAAGVLPDVEFATKPAQARQLIADTLDAGVGARWVAGDEVYGADPRLRA